MGDTLGLIYPHGNFVQPNLPPPDFNKEVLFKTLDEINTLDLKYLALAHFGIHNNPYELINNAKESIELWIDFVSKLPNLSIDEATESLQTWLRGNYRILNIDEETINNYLNNGNFKMQIQGIRKYLNID